MKNTSCCNAHGFVFSKTESWTSGSKKKRHVVLRGDVVKADTRLYAEFTEHGSSASHMRAAKGLDVASRMGRTSK